MTMPLHIDDSAVLWSRPATDPAPLVLLLHGRGSDERDLFSLTGLLPPEFTYASVRAPHPEGPGWSWFLAGEPGRPDAASAVSAADAVADWLDRVAPGREVSAIGFSQGGAMTLQLLRRDPARVTCCVNLAGFLVDGADFGRDDELPASVRPVLWGRDPADPVIPSSAIARTLAWLPTRSQLEVHEYPGIGHSISREEAADVAAFLRAHVPGAASAETDRASDVSAS